MGNGEVEGEAKFGRLNGPRSKAGPTTFLGPKEPLSSIV